MKSSIRKLFLIAISIIALFTLTLLSSCSDDEEPVTPDCTGCTSSSPWSTPGNATCYATRADCEAVEGTGCQLCD